MILTFLGNFQDGRTTEASLPRQKIEMYVRRLFKREDFPQEIFIILADSSVASQGDVVWANLDNEHPYDFVPMSCIDGLILNLPTKKQFLEAVGADQLSEVSAEAENRFWQGYPFQFAKEADGVNLKWS